MLKKTSQTIHPGSGLRHNADLSRFNSFGVAAGARYFTEITAASAFRELTRHPVYRQCERLILGGGSNILFTRDFDGLVLKIAVPGIETLREDEHSVWVRAGAGVNWHSFVVHCLDHNYAGIENLSLIPGNVGAAPVQNIGAYGVELEEVFDHLEAVDCETGEEALFDRADCRFAYRDSIFKNELKNRWIITSVTLKLNKKPDLKLGYGDVARTLEETGVKHPTIRDVSEAVCRIRRSKLPDPTELGNAGSFFKNPEIDAGLLEQLRKKFPSVPAYPVKDESKVKIPAGWLIEQCGWKGKTSGKTGTHVRQALVIVNYGGATGREIYDFAMQVREAVKSEFGIELVPEVNII